MTPRTGPKPRTTSSNPHTQLDQNAPRALYDALAARMFALPDAEERPSRVSVPGARALWLRDGVEPGAADAFMIEREFAHLHPARDGSLHMALPHRRAETAIASGWAELHPIARLGYLPQTVVMVFGPRTPDELEVVWGLVLESYRNAGGRALP
ncbi:MAG: luciferase domain-containing protein [Polyangia bacterium]